MRRLGRWVAVGLLATTMLAACTGAEDAGTTEAAAPEATGEIGEEAADGNRAGEAGEDTAAADRDDADGGGPDTEGDTTVAVGGETGGRDVIRRAEVALASDDPEQTVDAIAAAAERAGGFVSGTDLRREGGVLAGTVTVRVPAEELGATLGRIEAAGAEVRSRSISSEDVTGELTDIEAQLRNLRALETQLVDLLADARETGETQQVLGVFERIREVRDEIERLEGRQARLDDLVALATVTVDVEPTPELLARTAPQRDPEPEPWSIGRQVEVAWDTTLGALRALAQGGIVLGVTVLPVLLVVVLPFAAVALAVRAAWRRRGGRSGAGPGDPGTVVGS